MPQERYPKQALHVKGNGKRPVGRPKTKWTNYIADLGWNCSGLHESERMEVMEDGEERRLNVGLLCPRNPHDKLGNEGKRRTINIKNRII